jgi:hypothetical protein
MRAWLSRLAALLRRRELDARLDEEVQALMPLLAVRAASMQ